MHVPESVGPRLLAGARVLRVWREALGFHLAIGRGIVIPEFCPDFWAFQERHALQRGVMGPNRIGRVAICVVAPLLAGGAVAAQAVPAQAAANSYQGPVFVSPGGNPAAGGQSCDTARYTSIQAAINAAPSGGSVVVCAGTYQQQVVIVKALTLTGQHATIDESNVTPPGDRTVSAAVAILGSNVKVTGFTVQNAPGDGILAAGGTRITISQDSVVDNGQGVRLTGVSGATIEHDTLSGNSGGILLSDQTGPTDNNVVQNNTVTASSASAGIALVASNPDGQAAGVYRNSIKHNQVTYNAGAGVLVATAGNGTAAHDNLVEANYLLGNGQAGVSMQAVGQSTDLSDNQVSSNVIDTNGNQNGQAANVATTGIQVSSASAPVAVQIGTNHISDDAVGIWLSQAVTATGLTSNIFTSVGTPISAGH